MGLRALATATCCDAEDLLAATFVTLTFTQQKQNGVRNEMIGHGCLGHPHICPVLALASRVIMLRAQGASPETALNAVRTHPGAPFPYFTLASLTTRIRATLHLHPDPAYTLADVSICSTQAGGMAFLCAGVNSNQIRFVGSWLVRWDGSIP